MTSKPPTRAARIAQSGSAGIGARSHRDRCACIGRVVHPLRPSPMAPGAPRSEPRPITGTWDLQPGIRFAWRNQGFTLRATVQRLRNDEELTWTGQALWLVAIHRNTIDATATGCRLVSEESMTGWGAAHLMPSRKLEEQLGGFIQAIAHEAERRHDRG